MKKVDRSQFIPVTLGFGLTARPIGYVDVTTEDVKFKIRADAKITMDDIKNGKRTLAPSFIITETDKQGNVTELALAGMAVVTPDSEV